ncbi:MAG TPA: DUF4147 domain-containing protein [Methylomirabilota bacterium]|nr:DUF4147 domain-containing protein [Methylomirabilota bacterium]
MPYIKNYDALATNDNRKVVLELIETAFASIAPERVFQKDFSLQDKRLKIQDKTFDLDNFDHVFLVGFGKGSSGICKMLEEKLGNLITEGYDIDVVDETFKKVKYTKGTHPLPSQANFDFTETVITRLSKLTEKDLVIIVTCGGGSVLFEKPHTFTLDHMITVNKALLNSGATISEMNVIRKHLSSIKGGGLAKILYPATVANLIFSDVPGNDLSVIASAPLVQDPTSMQDAITILSKYTFDQNDLLSDADFHETPKDAKYFEKVTNILMLSNLTALNAMEKRARQLGYHCYVMTDRLEGDARTMGEKLIKEAPIGQILLAGGETTIKITGNGRGGRNQALVLCSLPFIKDDTIIATFDSDGWDFYGYSGAIADKETLKKVTDQQLDVKEFLHDDNSFGFFEKVGDGIDTGKLQSNVSDLFIVLRK